MATFKILRNKHSKENSVISFHDLTLLCFGIIRQNVSNSISPSDIASILTQYVSGCFFDIAFKDKPGKRHAFSLLLFQKEFEQFGKHLLPRNPSITNINSNTNNTNHTHNTKNMYTSNNCISNTTSNSTSIEGQNRVSLSIKFVESDCNYSLYNGSNGYGYSIQCGVVVVPKIRRTFNGEKFRDYFENTPNNETEQRIDNLFFTYKTMDNLSLGGCSDGYCYNLHWWNDTSGHFCSLGKNNDYETLILTQQVQCIKKNDVIRLSLDYDFGVKKYYLTFYQNEKLIAASPNGYQKNDGRIQLDGKDHDYYLAFASTSCTCQNTKGFKFLCVLEDEFY